MLVRYKGQLYKRVDMISGDETGPFGGFQGQKRLMSLRIHKSLTNALVQVRDAWMSLDENQTLKKDARVKKLVKEIAKLEDDISKMRGHVENELK